MRKYLSDRNLVIILFILVLITFSFAHEDSKALQEFSTKGSVSANNGLATPAKIAKLPSASGVESNSASVSR